MSNLRFCIRIQVSLESGIFHHFDIWFDHYRYQQYFEKSNDSYKAEPYTHIFPAYALDIWLNENFLLMGRMYHIARRDLFYSNNKVVQIPSEIWIFRPLDPIKFHRIKTIEKIKIQVYTTFNSKSIVEEILVNFDIRKIETIKQGFYIYIKKKTVCEWLALNGIHFQDYHIVNLAR